MVSFDSATREQDYLAESECLWRESEHGAGGEGRGGGLRNAMHVWEVVLAGFEINDLHAFSGRESSQRKSADKSSGGAAVTAGMGRTKVFSPPPRKRGKAFVEARVPEEPGLQIRTCELRHRPSI